MKRVGELFERLTAFHHLHRSALLAARGKHRSVEVIRFLFNIERRIFEYRADLLGGTYCPGPFRIFEISDPKKRTIAAAPFRDRVLHHAICLLVEPIFERSYIFDSYACRRGKGPQHAIQRAQHFARRSEYFLKLDVRKYFASVDRNVLKSLIERKIKDRKFLSLLDRIIDNPLQEDSPGKGLPIGNLTSQHFANFYLNGLDHFVLDRVRPNGYLRYMDDMILFGDEKASLWRAREGISKFLNSFLALELKQSATKLAPVSEGVPFLGFRVYRNVRRLSSDHLKRLRRKIKRRQSALANKGISERSYLDSVRSLISYAGHGNTRNIRNSLFSNSAIEDI